MQRGDVDNKYEDCGWLYQKYIIEELSMPKLGEKCGVTGAAIKYWLDKHDISTRSRSAAATDGDVDKLQDQDWMHRQYVDRGQPATKLATMCDVDDTTVYTWLRKHDISIRDIGETKCGPGYEKLQDPAWLQEKYHEQKLGERQVADLIDVSRGAVRNWLERHGIEKRPAPLNGLDRTRLNNPDYLSQRYADGLSVPQIAAELNAHETTVYNKFCKFGIDRRGHDKCHPAGADHPQFKEKYTDNYGPNWDAQRLSARMRDQGRCQQCGKTDAKHVDETGFVNHVHHITAFREFVNQTGEANYTAANRLDNLITLCCVCHTRLEGLPIDSPASNKNTN